jgi:hypothetical protein
MLQVLVVIDGFADSPELTRGTRLLQELYSRGRHQFISTITSTHVYKVIRPVVHHGSHIYVFLD